MAHYAFINDENIVTDVIVGIDENEKIEGQTPEKWYGDFRGQRCIRTSFNGNIRKRFAGIGMIYLEEIDAFSYVQCHEEAIFDEETATWNCEHLDHAAR